MSKDFSTEALTKSLSNYPVIKGWSLAQNGESIADTLRHDQDHHDWHAMWGDPPCKNEADCAQMRAKYKAMEAAGLGPMNKAYFTKGDVMGHEFHGNQYGPAATELANRVQSEGKGSTTSPEGVTLPNNDGTAETAKVRGEAFVMEHANLAGRHEVSAMELAQKAIDLIGSNKDTTALEDARDAHDAAATAHYDAARAARTYANDPTMDQNLSQASLKAAQASRIADAMTALTK